MGLHEGFPLIDGLAKDSEQSSPADYEWEGQYQISWEWWGVPECYSAPVVYQQKLGNAKQLGVKAVLSFTSGPGIVSSSHIKWLFFLPFLSGQMLRQYFVYLTLYLVRVLSSHLLSLLFAALL